MATQTGLQVAGPNEPYTVVDTIPVPVPGPKQVLVKSLATGINPVEPMMQHTGSNVVSPWPVVLGCEGSGVVVAAGPGVTRFRVGDGIFGCTSVGVTECATFQEHFLMDEDTSYKRPPGMSAEEASTLGVAIATAMLGLAAGLDVRLPDAGSKAEEKDEWIIVLGGSGSVGAVAVQLARLAGYKVLASSSPTKSSVPLNHGATATLDHTAPLGDQVDTIKKVTEGKFGKVFDASARAHETGLAALEQVSTASEKLFSTANTWTPFVMPPGVREHRCKLGEMGKGSPLGREVTAQLTEWTPGLERHLAEGHIKPLEYELVQGKGWEAIVRAVQIFEKGVDKKLVVRVQDE